jgi:hypothetical protein
MQIFYGSFACANDVFEGFAVPEKDRNGIEFIYAAYDQGDYEGDAHVIFTKDRALYEVNGSHCSCNGLEDCWKPEETSLVALMFRPNVSEQAKDNLKRKYRGLIAFM